MFFDSSIIIQGIIVGFSIAAPVGPIGLLCIQNTISHGMLFGLVCGLGAATADMMYGVLVVVGTSYMATVMQIFKIPLSVFGGIFLIYLGLKKILAKPASKAASVNSKMLIGAYFSTFILTLINPATILDFIALFAGLRVNVSDYTQGLSFVGGVFFGSAFWWILLSSFVAIFRKKMSDFVIILINYFAGVAICGFGFFALTKVII